MGQRCQRGGDAVERRQRRHGERAPHERDLAVMDVPKLRRHERADGDREQQADERERPRPWQRELTERGGIRRRYAAGKYGPGSERAASDFRWRGHREDTAEAYCWTVAQAPDRSKTFNLRADDALHASCRYCLITAATVATRPGESVRAVPRRCRAFSVPHRPRVRPMPKLRRPFPTGFRGWPRRRRKCGRAPVQQARLAPTGRPAPQPRTHPASTVRGSIASHLSA